MVWDESCGTHAVRGHVDLVDLDELIAELEPERPGLAAGRELGDHHGA